MAPRFRATARALAGLSLALLVTAGCDPKPAENTGETAGNTATNAPTSTNPPGPATDAGHKVETAVEGAVEKGEDAIITAKVKSALIADEKVGASGIDVDTVNEKVTLKGVVKTAEAKKLAEQIAKKTQGVKGVANQLTVGH